MGILKLQDAVKSMIFDYGDDILDDSGALKAYLDECSGDENREEIEILISALDGNIPQDILNKKEFDDQEQSLFISNAVNSIAPLNEGIANSVLEMLFAVFYDCGMIYRRTESNDANLIDYKIELWKKKLLAAGKRNRLLHFRDTKMASLRFVSPTMEELWSKVVVKGRSLEFIYTEEFAEGGNSGNTGLETEPHRVITNQSPVDQQKTLRNLKTKAKRIHEEQGINALHIAFGFLNWNENNASASSPLILVPVHIAQKSIRSPFLLTVGGGDVTVNPALSQKLDIEFGIKMPEFDIDADIRVFIDDISEKVKNIKNCSCSSDTVLSLFSFNKKIMYDDLVKNTGKIRNHPVIKAFAGDASCLRDPSSINFAEYDHDNKNPQNSFQVLDADSTQQDAIASAKNGLSFILQGAPGTGKSQTIANIIAECLAAHKKVLFVSEKAAALDVVHKRLANAGLGDFCLTLHSHKSNKKDIIEEIGKNLHVALQRQNDDDAFTFSKLYKDIKTINEYSNGIHIKLPGLQKSVYEIYGELIKLHEYADVQFNLPGIESLTTDDFYNLITAVDAYAATFHNFSSDFRVNPWNGINISDLSYEFKYSLNVNINELYAGLLDFEPLYHKIRERFSIKTSDFNSISEVLAVCTEAKPIYENWLKHDRIETLQNTLFLGENKCKAIKLKLNELHNYLNENRDVQFNINLDNLDTTKTLSEFNMLINSFKSYVKRDICSAAWEGLYDFSVVKEQQNLLRSYIKNDPCFSKWERLYGFSSVKELFETVQEKIAAFNALKNEILLTYEDSIFSINVKSMVKKFQMEYISFLKIVKKQYKIDRKEIISCHKNITKDTIKKKDSHIVSDLQKILKMNEIEDWFISEQNALEEYFSTYCKGVKTDLSALRSKINEFDKIITLKTIFTDVYQIISSISEIDSDLKRRFRQYVNGSDAGWEEIKVIPSVARDYLMKYKKKYRLLVSLFERYSDLYNDKIFIDKDITNILDTLKECIKNITDVHRYINGKINEFDKIIILSALFTDANQLFSSIAEFNNDLRKCIKYYNNIDTDWEKLKISESCSREITFLIDKYSLETKFVQNICFDKEIPSITRDYLMRFSEKYGELNTLFEWYCSLPNSEMVKNKEVSGILDIVKDCNRNIADNYRYIVYKINELDKTITLTKKFTDVYQMFISISELDNDLKDCFQRYYNGINTEWEELKIAVTWTQKIYLLIEKYGMEKDFIRKICYDENLSSSAHEYMVRYSEKYNALLPLMEWFRKLFNDKIFYDRDIELITHKVKYCYENTGNIEQYINYKNERDHCLSLGLISFISAIELENTGKENITPIFKKHFYTMWIDRALHQYDAVKRFRKISHEKMIDEYKELDVKQLSIASMRIREMLVNQMPAQFIYDKSGDEIRVLQHEMNKPGKVMPIRKLFQKIPNLLLTLKPCLMMSPLTVSLFLESDEFHFDTVIFDEASQVSIENAIGAIIRGNQAIIVGDSRQLPPTAFFAAAISDSGYDEEDHDDYTGVDFCESILDEAENALLPSQMLKWHYRSKHEDLIAFSNSSIYKNRLITFPSNIGKSPDNGVEYIYVENGIYDKRGRRDNKAEADAAVDLIFASIKKHPERSMGVITFSAAQSEAIDTCLRKKRLADNRFEDYFSEEKDEAFFIKNIETVQGDERDTIIFSIGYAKDNMGKMSMFFGPLSSVGGERRLNVAVTRAKYNMKFVGSLLPDDIQIERISSEGPKLLRQYIEFAMNDKKNNNVVNFDSSFEKYVYDFLTDTGFDVAVQVGCSGYRIDMAVRNPGNKSSYCLGIECDGMAYYSARTARERERLRQTVLENMGWKMYRIWSTEWIKNTGAEKEKLLDAIKSACKTSSFIA